MGTASFVMKFGGERHGNDWYYSTAKLLSLFLLSKTLSRCMQKNIGSCLSWL